MGTSHVCSVSSVLFCVCVSFVLFSVLFCGLDLLFCFVLVLFHVCLVLFCVCVSYVLFSVLFCGLDLLCCFAYAFRMFCFLFGSVAYVSCVVVCLSYFGHVCRAFHVICVVLSMFPVNVFCFVYAFRRICVLFCSVSDISCVVLC